MSELTKQALKVENNQSFPNNNAGLITPSALRTFNENMIDSLVDEIAYTADSASFNSRINNVTGSATNTGSLLTTASFDNNTRNLTFTKGDSSTFAVNIPDASGSILPSGVVSGSSQIDYPFISNIPSGIVSGSSQVSYTGLSNIPSGIVSGAAQVTPLLPSGTVSGSQQVVGILSSVNAFTASQQILNGTFATTGSNVFVGDQTINGNLNLTGSLTASGLRYPTTDGAFDKQVLQTNAAGTLSFGDVSTIYENIKNGETTTLTKGTCVHISGSQGATPIVFRADYNNPNTMPASHIVAENIAVGDTGRGVTLGLLTGLNLTGLGPAGTQLWVDGNGTLTATRATGSASIIQPMAVIVKEGNGGQINVLNPGPVLLPNIQQGYSWVGNSLNQPIAVTSASLSSYIFTQNNTFTGTQTFNNIAVNGTASIAYLESVTGSAKIIGDAFIVLNNDTPTERYAGIIVLDSGSAGTSASFQFDGLTNDWFYEYTGSDPLNFGVAMFGPEYGTKGSPTYLTNNRLPKGDGGHHLNDSNISDDGSNVSINSNTQITGSLLINGNAPLINSDLTSLNNFTQSQQSVNTNLNAFTSSASGRLNNIELTTASLQIEVDNLQSVTGSYATTGSNSFIGNQIVTGSVTISGSATNDLVLIGNMRVTGSVAGINNTITQEQILIDSASVQALINGANIVTTGLNGTQVQQITAENAEGTIGLFVDANGGYIRDYDPIASTYSNAIKLQSYSNYGVGQVQVLRPLQVTGSVNIQSTLTASLQQGFIFVGDANNRTTTIATSSLSSVPFPFTGSAQITGSLGITGSMSGFVNTLSVASSTASVNFSDGNMFVITLTGGATTHFTPSNIKAGQTINIQISQPSGASTGSVSFSPNVLFAGGNDYQVTATGSAIDLLTFVSLDGTNVLGTSIKNFL